jgi:hypothetical protein
MKRLIRSKATRLFLAAAGGWTDEVGQALRIGEFKDVWTTAQRLQLQEVELYYSFSDWVSEWDFALPLN